MTVYQAIMRPIEVNDGDTDFGFIVDAATTTVSLGDGVAPNMLAVLYGVESVKPSGTSFYLNSNGKVTISHPSLNVGVAITTQAQEDGARIMGFPAAISATTTSITAPYTPLHCWIPERHTSDLSRWFESQGFSGNNTSNGQQFGVTLPQQSTRIATWSKIPAPNCYKEAAVASYAGPISGTVYYPEAERCFEDVIIGSRRARLNYSDSGSISPKGFYYVDNLVDWTGLTPSNTWTSDFGGGGIQFDALTAAHRDQYRYCTCPEDVKRPGEVAALRALYYDVSLQMRTADAPSWDYTLPR